MNTVKDLLELALADGHGPRSDQIVDAAADVARGRRLLRRRRLASVGGVAVAAAAGVSVPLIVLAPAHPVATEHPGKQGVSLSPAPQGKQSIRLVAFTGDQPPGYQVADVPRGWVVQGGTPYALVIAPQGDPDTNVDSFTGKLVVMLLSSDASPPSSGTSVPVNGMRGFLDTQGDTQILIFQRPDGRWVDIQAPTSLGWDADTFAQFASGVQVL